MVDALGSVAVWGGMLLMLLGAVFFVIAAFRESILWGLGVLFLPFVALAYLVLGWPEAKRPFFLWLYGLGFVLAGVFLLEAPLPFIHHHHHW